MIGQARRRIAEDEHGPRTSFEDIEVGRDLGTLEWVIEASDIEKQCRIDDDHDPRYIQDREDAIAPPQIQYRPPRWLLSRNYNVRGVFYRWEFENLGPLRSGEPITVGGRILKKWVAKGREFVEFEATGTSAAGDILFRTRRTHVLDMADRQTPREGRGLDSGIKSEKI